MAGPRTSRVVVRPGASGMSTTTVTSVRSGRPASGPATTSAGWSRTAPSSGFGSPSSAEAPGSTVAIGIDRHRLPRRWTAASASAPEVAVERGADREPGSGEALARLTRRQVELDDSPAEWRPFDIDEGDETGIDRIEFGERCVHDAVLLGRDDIVLRTQHPRLAPSHGRIHPRAS